ncbi:MAG TPA: MFS transporter [Propionibacteriaceae bacterium]|nr:MFS transporter [Propionibacteriaceae bacterium]
MSPPNRPWSPWRVVLGFGFVSLAADMVYEGARSMYGPALLALGASAAVVGLVTGVGEAVALVLRLVAGPVADRRGGHWSFTIAGYAMTAVCVPLLAVAPAFGAAGLAVGALLIWSERAGKAIRSPSKSALLAHASQAVGRGKGFGVHKALDQTGAVLGPLLVAATVTGTASLWPGFAVLALPGMVAMALLLWIRHEVPDLTVYDPPGEPTTTPAPISSWWREALGSQLPPFFFMYAFAAALTTGGLVTFAVISVHLTRTLNVPVGLVPVIYAGAMGVEAVAAVVTGWVFDRRGASVLLVVPVLVALVPLLAFTGALPVALVGVAVWAAAYGIQDSTIKALVADVVPSDRLAGGYGVFAAIQGVFAIAGGFAAGYLLDRSVSVLVAVVGAAQVLAFFLLLRALRGAARPQGPT